MKAFIRIRGTLVLLFISTLGLLINGVGEKVLAQNEVTVQRNSLRGINSYYLSVNVEGSRKLTNSKALDVSRLQRDAAEKLKKAGTPLESSEKMPKGRDHPLLLMHINTMEAGRGIIPFAINIDFYQPIKLTLNRDKPHVASTWNTGNVGVVSYDNLPTIRKSALTLLEDFINDYKNANK